MGLKLTAAEVSSGAQSIPNVHFYGGKVEIGIKLGSLWNQAEEALDEMEMDDMKDGKVEFEEFWHWFAKKKVGLQQGSLAYQLIEARDNAFREHVQLLSLFITRKTCTWRPSAGNELTCSSSPMGKMLAAKARGGR